MAEEARDSGGRRRGEELAMFCLGLAIVALLRLASMFWDPPTVSPMPGALLLDCGFYIVATLASWWLDGYLWDRDGGFRWRWWAVGLTLALALGIGMDKSHAAIGSNASVLPFLVGYAFARRQMRVNAPLENEPEVRADG